MASGYSAVVQRPTADEEKNVIPEACQYEGLRRASQKIAENQTAPAGCMIKSPGRQRTEELRAWDEEVSYSTVQDGVGCRALVPSLRELNLILHSTSDTQGARQSLRPRLSGFRFNSKVGIELILDKWGLLQ